MQYLHRRAGRRIPGSPDGKIPGGLSDQKRNGTGEIYEKIWNYCDIEGILNSTAAIIPVNDHITFVPYFVFEYEWMAISGSFRKSGFFIAVFCGYILIKYV